MELDGEGFVQEKLCPGESISKKDLIDIRKMETDTDLPVRVSFVNEGQKLSEALIRYFCSLK